MLNLEAVQCGKVRMSLTRDPEVVVAGYMDGTTQVPAEVKPLVEVYVKYAKCTFKCIQYPRYIDATMNAIFDALVALVEKGAI